MLKYPGSGLPLLNIGNLYLRLLRYVLPFIRVPAFLWENQYGLYHSLLEPSCPTVYIADPIGFSAWALPYSETCMIVSAIIAILQDLRHFGGDGFMRLHLYDLDLNPMSLARLVFIPYRAPIVQA